MTASEVYAAAGMEMLERDGDTIHVVIQTSDGPVSVMAELIRIEDRLIIDRAHVDGRGLM